MDFQPTLSGQLIRLRPLREQDYDAFFAAVSDPLIWDQHPAHRYKPEVFREFFAASYASGGCLIVEDVTDGILIGSSRFNSLEQNPNVVEIGWTVLARKYWGGTYNREMKRLMVAHLDGMGKRALLNIAGGNHRSARAAEKIGGQLVGKDYYPELVDPREGYRCYILPRQID